MSRFSDSHFSDLSLSLSLSCTLADGLLLLCFYSERRLKRALDISFKKKPLPDEIQKSLTPLEPYILGLLEEAKELRLERELLKGPR